MIWILNNIFALHLKPIILLNNTYNLQNQVPLTFVSFNKTDACYQYFHEWGQNILSSVSVLVMLGDARSCGINGINFVR